MPTASKLQERINTPVFKNQSTLLHLPANVHPCITAIKSLKIIVTSLSVTL